MAKKLGIEVDSERQRDELASILERYNIKCIQMYDDLGIVFLNQTSNSTSWGPTTEYKKYRHDSKYRMMDFYTFKSNHYSYVRRYTEYSNKKESTQKLTINPYN